MQARDTTIQQLLTGTKVFLVPLFQRRYQWSSKQWGDLWDDVLEQYEHPDVIGGSLPPGQGHFLGSIVLHPAPGPASTVSRYLVVDGQQRLTTLLALLAAVRDVRAGQDDTWDRATYTNQYLLNPFSTEHPDRLVPTTFDRDSYLNTIRDGLPSGAIGHAYEWFSRALTRLHEAHEEGGGIDYDRLERAVLLRLLVVDISTSHADNVNNIFNTVNSKGLNLDPIDLIRNHVFMQMDPARAEAAHREYWMPLEERLSAGDKKQAGHLQRFAWAYLVRSDAKATQKELFASFEKRMELLMQGVAGDDLQRAIEAELARFEMASRLFLMIDRPSSAPAAALPARVRSVLTDLKAWGGETHLPVSLEILWQLHHGEADADSAASALRHVLSYLVRRAVCGIPTNNLTRIFSGLPSQLDRSLPLDRAVAAFLGVGQRYWPTDAEVRQKVATTPLYVSAKPVQVRFLLAEIERHLWPQEPVDPQGLEVEHVLPQTMTPEWRRYLRDHGDEPDETQTRLHTLGNLTLTGFNEKLSNQQFDKKARTYASSSIRLNQDIAAVPAWTEAAIVERAARLAEVVIELYPRVAPEPVDQEIPIDETMSDLDLADVLLQVPAGSWTSREDLMQLFASTSEEMEERLVGLSDLLLARVLTAEGDLPDWIPEHRRDAVEAQRDSAGTDEVVGWAADHLPRLVTAAELGELISGEELEPLPSEP